MLSVELEIKEGTPLQYGVLTIYSLNGNSYAALIPLKADLSPARADVMICACDSPEEKEDIDFYLISDREEYQAAATAFRKVLQSL